MQTCVPLTITLAAWDETRAAGFTVHCGETLRWSFDGSQNGLSGPIVILAGRTLIITGNGRMRIEGELTVRGVLTVANVVTGLDSIIRAQLWWAQEVLFPFRM